MGIEKPEESADKFRKERVNRIIMVVFAVLITIGIILSIFYELDLIPQSYINRSKIQEKEFDKDKYEGSHRIFGTGFANEIPIEEPLREEIEKADSFFYNERYEESYKLYEDVYKKALSSENNKIVGFSLLGMGLSTGSQENYTEAIKIFEDAQTYEDYMNTSTKVKLIFNLGYCNYRIGNDSLALKYFDRAIELDPQQPNPYLYKGMIFFSQREGDTATKYFNEGIELDPEYFWGYYYRGNINYLEEDYDLAIQDYNKAIELSPEHAWLYDIRGRAFYRKTDYKSAIKDFNKAIELDPEEASFYFFRGNNYYKSKEFDNAIEDYNKTLELNPKEYKAYINEGQVYEILGKNKEALALYKKCLEVIGTEDTGDVWPGDILALKEKIEELQSSLEDSLSE